jgi:hypothetical protein
MWTRTGSPFTAVRWGPGQDETWVEVDGRWRRLRAVEGVAVEALVGKARERHGAEWQKRLSEDLGDLLALFDRPMPAEVTLEVEGDAPGSPTVIRAAATASNRLAVVAYNRLHAGGGTVRPRARHRSSAELSAEAARADLDQLQELLETRYVYLERGPRDHLARLAELRAEVSGGVARAQLALRIERLLGLWRDGHTRLAYPLARLLPAGIAPFSIERCREGYLALAPDRRGPLSPDFPFIVGLDSIELDRWIAAADCLRASGSPARIERQRLRNLQFLAFLRQELGLPPRATVRVELESAEGDRRTSLELDLLAAPEPPGSPIEPAWRPAGETPGRVVIPTMSHRPEHLAAILASLDALANEGRLVIDVRGNGGGSRGLLLAALPLLLERAAGPRVVNVAALLLAPGPPSPARPDLLADRAMFPACWPGWSHSEADLIARSAETFRPEWRPLAGRMSDWHYLVVTGTRRTPVKIAVLADEGSSSATEILLAGLSSAPGVRLFGGTSGGTSGRPRRHRLRRSGLELQLSSMLSLRADGSLIDGRGVAPDVQVARTLSDAVGTTDSTLEQARAWLIDGGG